MPLPTVRVATAHISPHLLDTPSTLSATLSCITHASRHAASLIAFPESSIPGFPIWASLLAPSHPATHSFFRRFADQSIYVDGPEIGELRRAAKANRIAVSLGFSEKARYSHGTLWNSNVIINEEGVVVVHHRKLVATWLEKLVWGHGDGYGLRTADIGVKATGTVDAVAGKVKVGALICGENTNPLARYAMMSQGEDVHISSWPAVWPSRIEPVHEGSESERVGSKAKGKNYDNVMANRMRAGAHCFEAKCFGVMCAAHLSTENIGVMKKIVAEDDEVMADHVERALNGVSRSPSMFLDSTGMPVMGWTVDEQGQKQERDILQNEEGILFADLNLEESVEGKQFHDLLGGYQRLDVFNLQVNRDRREPVTFNDEEIRCRD